MFPFKVLLLLGTELAKNFVCKLKKIPTSNWDLIASHNQKVQGYSSFYCG